MTTNRNIEFVSCPIVNNSTLEYKTSSVFLPIDYLDDNPNLYFSIGYQNAIQLDPTTDVILTDISYHNMQLVATWWDTYCFPDQSFVSNRPDDGFTNLEHLIDILGITDFCIEGIDDFADLWNCPANKSTVTIEDISDDMNHPVDMEIVV